MNVKTFISLLTAVSLGLGAVWVGRDLVLGGKGSTLVSLVKPTATVVAAKHDLSPGQTLAPEDVMLIEVPSGTLPGNVFNDPQLLKDRAVISPVVRGQVMFEGLLAPQGAEGGLMALVPKGMRAVTLEVSESSGMMGLLVQGCRVDVIATLHGNDGQQQMARTIVENAKVQAVGPRLQRGRSDDKDATMSKTVTLIVTTKDAEAIELASNSSKPRLVLRGMSDMDRTGSAGVTSAELTGQVTPSVDVVTASATTSPSDSPSAWQQLLAAVASHGGNVGRATPQQPVRWPVQIIRGNSESTIYYEMTPGKSAASATAASSTEVPSQNPTAAAAAPAAPAASTERPDPSLTGSSIR